MPIEVPEKKEVQQNEPNENQKICTYCQKRKIYQYTLFRNRLSGHFKIYKREELLAFSEKGKSVA